MKWDLKLIYRAYRYKYQLDREEIDYLTRAIQKGQTAVDIGAHKGGYLYWIDKAVGNSGKVYAFEPQKPLYDYLNRFVNRNGKLKVENLGLSDTKENKTFIIPNIKTGMSPGARIERVGDSEDYIETSIKTTTLDSYFFDNGIDVDFLKIDVEGHEKQLINGGVNLLKSSQPKILLECEQRHLTESTVGEVFHILFGLGYRGFFFFKGKKLPIAEFDINTHQNQSGDRFWEGPNYVNNFVFEARN